MILAFGWKKEAAPPHPALIAYCWYCQRETAWTLRRESESATFFAIHTIPFLRRDFVACTHCGDRVALKRAHARLFASPRGRAALAEYIESCQLSGKNATQRNFLRAMRAQRGFRPSRGLTLRAPA